MKLVDKNFSGTGSITGLVNNVEKCFERYSSATSNVLVLGITPELIINNE
jgi:hypothetical protein